MQQFGQHPSDGISSLEAQEVLRAWADRRQAQGVDPNVGSVTALAEALGVSDEEVRRMLEDVRVQKRSEQMAAGILQQESARRKKLDVTAAIGAAIAVVVVALIVGGVVLFGGVADAPVVAPAGASAEFLPPLPAEAVPPTPPEIEGLIDKEAIKREIEAALAEHRRALEELRSSPTREQEIAELKKSIEQLTARLKELEAQPSAR